MKEKLNNVILGSILIGLGITISDIIINNIQNTSSTSSSPSNSNNNEENEENKKKQKNSISPPTEIKEELFSRVKTFFGEEKFLQLENSFVIVVGVGGVGSHAANMLIRSGIKKIRVIDFDQVTLSSLNRHAVANSSDIGISKVETIAKHFRKIVPWIEVEPYAEMFRGENAERLLSGSPDYVLDCIDDVNTKAELLAYCIKNGIRVLTSMGAGGKSDPTKIRVGSLSDCVNDPLAHKIKWKLKKYNVSPDDVMTVFSAEKPVKDLLPLSDEQYASPEKFGAVENMRLRVIPVLGTSPAIFGQTMASYVLTQLGGCPYDPETAERLSKNVRHRMRQILGNNEKKRFNTNGEVNLDDDDMEFIVSQVWKTRCAVTGRRIGGQSLMVLTRWNSNEPLSPYNLVLIQQSVAPFVELRGESNSDSMLIDDKLVTNPLTPDVINRIQERLNWAKVICENDWPPKGIPDSNLTSINTSASTLALAPSTTTKVDTNNWSRNLRGPLIFIPSLLALLLVNLKGNKLFS